jgi:excisionase family DNA binding protein
MKEKTSLGVEKIARSKKLTAEMIGVSPGHVNNLIKRGELRAIKSGSRILIMDEDLRRYLEEKVVAPAAA